MAGPGLFVRGDALRSITFGSITATYTPFGAPLGHATRILKITNVSNSDVYISFDGTTNNDYVPAGGFVLYDVTTNGIGQEFTFAIGTQLYIKYASAPSSGSVFAT